MTEDTFTRDFLQKARLLKEETITKSFSIKKGILKEDTSNNEVVIDKSNENFIDVTKNIIQFVGALKTDEKSMIVYPTENDVIFNGVITDLNNLKFQFRYNDQSGGLYIWTDSMLLNKEICDKLSKLVTIREQWKDYWANNIGQYQNQQ